MKKSIFFLLFFLLSNYSFSAESVEKSYCLTSTDYEDVDTLKKALLINVKGLVASEFFGELIYSSTTVTNSILTHDEINSAIIGLTRSKGVPKFYNGEGFAEACVKINGFITKDDGKKAYPISLNKKHCLADQKLTSRDLKKQTRKEAILKALYDYNGRLKSKDPEDTIQLAQRVSFSESGFIAETETFCAKFSGVIIPLEITAFIMQNDDYKKQENNENILKKESILSGTLFQGSRSHPILLSMKINEENLIRGTIEFPGLNNATKEIIGGIDNNHIFFHETKLVSKKRTDAYVGINYNLDFNVKNQILIGTWNYGKDGGKIKINLDSNF